MIQLISKNVIIKEISKFLIEFIYKQMPFRLFKLLTEMLIWLHMKQGAIFFKLYVIF